MEAVLDDVPRRIPVVGTPMSSGSSNPSMTAFRPRIEFSGFASRLAAPRPLRAVRAPGARARSRSRQPPLGRSPRPLLPRPPTVSHRVQRIYQQGHDLIPPECLTNQPREPRVDEYSELSSAHPLLFSQSHPDAGGLDRRGYRKAARRRPRPFVFTQKLQSPACAIFRRRIINNHERLAGRPNNKFRNYSCWYTSLNRWSRLIPVFDSVCDARLQVLNEVETL